MSNTDVKLQNSSANDPDPRSYQRISQQKAPLRSNDEQREIIMI